MSIHADSTGERNMSSAETCIKHRAFNQDGCFSCQMCVKKWFVCVCVGVFVCVWGWLFSWTWFPNACCSGYHKNIALPPLSASQRISKLSHCLISSSSNRVILAWLSEFPHVEKNTCCFNYTWPRITELWNSVMSHSPPQIRQTTWDKSGVSRSGTEESVFFCTFNMMHDQEYYWRVPRSLHL